MSEESPNPHTLLLVYLFAGIALLYTLLFGLGDLQVSLVGMVSGKAERNTDVSFTLNDDTSHIDFVR